MLYKLFFFLITPYLPRSNILTCWRSRANQITTTCKLQEITQDRRSVRAACYRRYEGDKVGCAGEQAFVVDAFLFFHQTLVLLTSVPLVLSLAPPWKDRLLVKMWVPLSKAKLLCPLFQEVLLVI